MIVDGLVLAGGRSSRFGREKALAEVAGRPMIAWVLEVLTPACRAVAVNARPAALAADYGARAGCTILADDPSDPKGPLAGVRAGLAWAHARGADVLATAPCDTPFLPLDLVERLAQDWVPGQGARVAVSPAGPAPLCALWPIGPALEVVGEALAAGRHPPVRRVLEALGAVDVAFPDAGAFDNLNTPADYGAAISARARPG